MRRYAMLAALLATVSAPIAARAEEPVDLKPGPGREVVEMRCNACHSLDYIRMNSPFLTPDAWKAEVTKMRTAFGAPVEDAEVAAILQYLTTAYGAPPS
ncbi:hypothetical protein [Limobrevibacterium gyesilva]|uniref:Quinohemoprotein amine dehydrogenase alpha subunit haem binding domain-containing protein n=1 Tax=Limobrevibacterium gyesilva TaxID=2991712 RepID=A0AA41YKT9_9PROT|nr:hypothetical protein [Limobrevibacterium gyesilva]MCW3474450.1 hypothetical protein [Limobrevibacterium gyesilva]